jgi:L-seryl-tRNA(Ser) seleniumtransferase
VERLIQQSGRATVTDAIREVLAAARADLAAGRPGGEVSEAILVDRVAAHLAAEARPSLRPVFNLTGTVLHTNLGRAPLPDEAVEAVSTAARRPANLEFDLETGARGDRDTLAVRKEVPTSRGELIEIGGSFRMPEIMRRAGCRLREVGTTNRVHLADYADAIGPRTGVVMKVHTSNYAIVGFTSTVPEPDIARLCRERGVPFVVDLGSGMLVDLGAYGLPHEPTPSETLANGADVVTFSGDKLLGGPQAGLIVGSAALIRRLKRNPLKRALRVDKLTMAALSAVLTLYKDPDRLADRLPVLRLLTRPLVQIRATADRLRPILAAAVSEVASVDVVACDGQIGSGALPTQTIPSAGLAVRPLAGLRPGSTLQRITAAFRRLPVPVVGRIQDDAFIMDLRCLDDEATFTAQLTALSLTRAE